MIDFLYKIAAFAVTLGVLVVIHELGHYAVARLAGVKVLRFSVGFGRALWTRLGGPDRTEYVLAAVPLGAFVAIPAIRLSGIYLALATFGFGILMERVVYPTALMFGGRGFRLAPRPGA